MGIYVRFSVDFVVEEAKTLRLGHKSHRIFKKGATHMNVLQKVGDAVTDTYVACKVEFNENRKAYKPWFAGGLLGGMAMALGQVALADDDVTNLANNITQAIENIYNASFGVITVFAALMALFAFVMRMTSNQQKAAQATSWLIRIGIAYGGINVIGLIFKAINAATDGRHGVDELKGLYSANAGATPAATATPRP